MIIAMRLLLSLMVVCKKGKSRARIIIVLNESLLLESIGGLASEN